MVGVLVISNKIYCLAYYCFDSSVFLRKPVTQLIEKIAEWKLATLKYGDFEATFSQGLQKVESELDESDTSGSSEPDDSQTNKEPSLENSSVDMSGSIVVGDNNSDTNINMIAREAPYLAVVLSWVLVEHELDAAMARVGFDSDTLKGKFVTAKLKMRYLIENKYLDKSYYDAFSDLLRLKNVASHEYKEAKNISYYDSMKYNKLTKKIIKGLKDIAPF
ncbi:MULTISPECIES: hypothetical protein [Bacillus amyloliquefaciens group]|uniref:hypothetical protein n=2 Tax=Bacillaceae TaxID=186817 RepID=UPI00057C2D60|nr:MULTISPECIES: hypothetical protein [Bacillus amyloliquefaciens group]MEB3986910.1 hypothetical protein [Bacillus velezensis]POR14253.1 hypothetical protein B9W23_10865 [Bacillus velezensis]QCE19635.1 hypothetical protein SB21_15355 [Bacillus velezensis]UFK56350.1 hypothetical protein LOZ87_15200 [Bacillus amyloliquefaciens]